MIQYSLLDRRPEEAGLSLLAEHNVGVLARGTLAKGLLIDKPAKSYLDHSLEDVSKAARAIRTIDGKSATQVAIRYALHPPAVASAVVGIRTSQQLSKLLEFDPSLALAPEELDSLKSSTRSEIYQAHR